MTGAARDDCLSHLPMRYRRVSLERSVCDSIIDIQIQRWSSSTRGQPSTQSNDGISGHAFEHFGESGIAESQPEERHCERTNVLQDLARLSLGLGKFREIQLSRALDSICPAKTQSMIRVGREPLGCQCSIDSLHASTLEFHLRPFDSTIDPSSGDVR